MDEFPKWVDSSKGRLVVANEAEEKAVADGTADIEVIESAQGQILKVSVPPAKPPKPEPKPAPKEPKPVFHRPSRQMPVDEPSTRAGRSRRGRR